MHILIIRKSDSAKVLTYEDDSIVEQENYPFEDFSYVELVVESVSAFSTKFEKNPNLFSWDSDNNEVVYNDENNPLKQEVSKYRQRITDGVEFIATVTAELRINSVDNELPRSINQEIQATFSEVMSALSYGLWISAKEKCELITIEGNVTQELWDRIYNTITDYIAVSY